MNVTRSQVIYSIILYSPFKTVTCWPYMMKFVTYIVLFNTVSPDLFYDYGPHRSSRCTSGDLTTYAACGSQTVAYWVSMGNGRTHLGHSDDVNNNRTNQSAMFAWFARRRGHVVLVFSLTAYGCTHQCELDADCLYVHLRIFISWPRLV